MQTTLRTLALAAAVAAVASPAARAGTDVSIYVAYQKGDQSETKIDSGGLSGSRLGFSASHDLPGGMKVLGRLEAGVAADSGNATQGGRVWGRQTWVGLSGGFGTLTLGRQYTPNFIAVDSDDPFETGAGSAASSGIVSLVGGPRKDHSLVYELPKMGSVSASFMYAMGEQPGDRSHGAFFAGSARYADGPLGLGVAYARQAAPDAASVAATSLLLAGSFDFGAAKLMGGFQAVRNLTHAANVDDNRDEAFLGVQVPVGEGSFWAGAGTGRFKNQSGTRATQGSVAYLHKLDKSTTVYGVLTSISNGSAAAYTTDTATGSGPAVSAGKNASALQVGIRYRF